MAKAATMEEAEQILSKCRALSSRAATVANRLTGEGDSIAAEATSLEQSIKKAMADAKDASGSSASAHLQEAKKVLHGLGPGGDLRKYMKPKAPFMLRMMIGTKVNVIAHRMDQSTAIKEEYYRFRDQSALIMLVASSVLSVGMAHAQAVREQPHGGHSFAPALMTGLQLYLSWLCYFYMSLALRENVLMVNGSHIKGWWVKHHYFSTMASLLMLGLPVYSPAVFEFCKRFMNWSCLQAVVMMIQNHYQRRRMYTRIALGKNTAMDVVAGESSGGSGQLLLLYPMLFVLQIWQAYIGAMVALKMFPSFLNEEGWLEEERLESDLRGTRGICLVGITFCYMAVNNLVTTVLTLLEKRVYKTKAKKTLARASGGVAKKE